MSITTRIEWCDSTLNLEMGCDGCELWNPKVGEKTCYAGILHERYAGHNSGFPESFDKPKLFPDRLKEALRWPDLTGKERREKMWLNGLPRLIFLDDMGDTFTESLPLDWLAPHLPEMAVMPHIFIVLTKRANRMREFSKTYPFPKNFWLLVSVTSAANYNRIEQLMEVCGGSVKGISYEPAWGAISIHRWADRLEWIIAGGASGTNATPAHPDWFRSVRDECIAARIPYFFKQWGEWAAYHEAGLSNGWKRTGTNPIRGKLTGLFGDPDFSAFDGRNFETRFIGPTHVGTVRVGKKAAGALLDGREWRQFPEMDKFETGGVAP